MGTPELISPIHPGGRRQAPGAAQLPHQGAPVHRRGPAGGPRGRRAPRPEGASTLIELFATVEAAERYADIVEAALLAGARVHYADDEVLAEVSQTVTPQGLVGVCHFLDSPFEDILKAARSSSPSSPTSATPGTPAPCCAARTPPEPTPWC